MQRQDKLRGQHPRRANQSAPSRPRGLQPRDGHPGADTGEQGGPKFNHWRPTEHLENGY